jgi:pimeloyl-ACP methyl ester carboxylesterase
MPAGVLYPYQTIKPRQRQELSDACARQRCGCSSMSRREPGARRKPTLLMLHGGPGADHSIYKPDCSGLAEFAQIVYLDHRGFRICIASSVRPW